MELLHSSRSRTFIAVVTLIFVGTLFAAPTAFAARRVSPFGMTSHVLGDYSHSQIDRELDLVARAGGSWIRLDVPWRFVEPAEGIYSTHALGQIDYIIAAAAKRRIHVQAVIVEFPKWTNGGHGMWVPPSDNSKFESYMQFMAARYAGRINYWELGNEVNEDEFWRPLSGNPVQRYVQFLQYGYRGVKAGNPSAMVISAGLAGSDYDFLQELYDAGAQGYFDILGVHPYTMGRSPYAVDSKQPGSTFAGLAYMKRKLEQNGDADKKIWVTEVGWQTSRVGHHVTQQRQAEYTYKAYKRLFNELPYVEMMLIYNARDAGTNLYNSTENYGLIRRNYSAKPAYAAFRKAFDTYQAVPTHMYIASSKSTVKRRRTVVVSGSLATVPRASVWLQRRVGSHWVKVRKLRTDGEGHYSTKLVFKTRGTKRYRVVYAGYNLYRAAHSRTLSIIVR